MLVRPATTDVALATPMAMALHHLRTSTFRFNLSEHLCRPECNGGAVRESTGIGTSSAARPATVSLMTHAAARALGLHAGALVARTMYAPWLHTR